MAIDPTGKRLQHIAFKNRKKVRGEDDARWPLDKKIEVVKYWLVTGDLTKTGLDLKVPYSTLRKWKAASWWNELVHEVRVTQNIQSDSKLTRIIEKSLEETMDRLENGDFIYDQKTGQIRRKPAALRDVHRVSVDLMQRQEALRDGANDRKETAQVSVQEQLSLLAREFAKWVDKDKHPVIELEEVEDAVYSEQSDMQEMFEDGDSVQESLAQSESEVVSSEDLPGVRIPGNEETPRE